MESEEAPFGVNACIVPVVPQHIPAAMTHSVPFRVFFDIFMALSRKARLASAGARRHAAHRVGDIRQQLPDDFTFIFDSSESLF